LAPTPGVQIAKAVNDRMASTHDPAMVKLYSDDCLACESKRIARDRQ
jgi:hypothetical protein